MFFFAVIDPIGTLPVFLAVTTQFDARTKRVVALKAFFISATVLVCFVVLGELYLNLVGISLPAFEIAGGAILFVFALTMIFGDGKPDEEVTQYQRRSLDTQRRHQQVAQVQSPAGGEPNEMQRCGCFASTNSNNSDDGSTAVAIFPLAIPSLASPGAILAAVLRTSNQLSIVDQAIVTAEMLSVLVIALATMLGASWIFLLIGDNGAKLLSRVMGLILASVAVDSLLNGFGAYYSVIAGDGQYPNEKSYNYTNGI